MSLWPVDQGASLSCSTVYPLWLITFHCICSEKEGGRALLAICFAVVTDDHPAQSSGSGYVPLFRLAQKSEPGKKKKSKNKNTTNMGGVMHQFLDEANLISFTSMIDFFQENYQVKI